jgi:hypothetical protein
MTTRRQRCPGDGGIGGDVVFVAILDESQELSEKLLGPSKLVAEGATHVQVVVEGLAEDDHGMSPGQRRAMVRRAS